MGIVLYAPSLGETANDHGAEPLVKIAEERGDAFRFLEFDWNQTVDDWVDSVAQACSKCDPKETTLVGMSLGSMSALVATSRMDVELQPSRLVLLSLSARFGEDFPNLPSEHVQKFTKAQREAFERSRFNDLAPRVACPTLLMMGSLEYRRLPTLATRVHKAKELIPNAKLVIAEEAGHALYYAGYQKALRAHL